MSRSSLVSVVTALRVEWFRVRIPVGARDLFFLQNFLTGSGAHPAPCSIRCSILWVKLVRREGNHSPPSSAEVKNQWNSDPVPPIRLHILDRENFTFSPSPPVASMEFLLIFLDYTLVWSCQCVTVRNLKTKITTN